MVLKHPSRKSDGNAVHLVSRRQRDDLPKRRVGSTGKWFTGGRELDPTTRNQLETSFGVDFGRVRIHAGPDAADMARSKGARAFAVGEDIVFGERNYDPRSTAGRHLLAHELAHVVQQRKDGAGDNLEARAARAADVVTGGGRVISDALGGAPIGIHRDNGEEEKKKPPSGPTVPEYSLDPSGGDQAGSPALQVPKLQLTPPSLLMPPPTATSHLGGALMPPLTLGGKKKKGSDPAPTMPSRLPVFDRGKFSLGLRLGFPKPEKIGDPAAPPSMLAESLRKAAIMNQTLTGKVPSSWESMDKGELASAVWGIFSTHIAPDVAKKITSGLSTSAGPAGTSAELDLVLITDFSKEIGGGLNLTVRWF